MRLRGKSLHLYLELMKAAVCFNDVSYRSSVPAANSRPTKACT